MAAEDEGAWDLSLVCCIVGISSQSLLINAVLQLAMIKRHSHTKASTA